MQPNFTREMILRAEPDCRHFTTVSFFEPKMRWQLRTYDMTGKKISETEIQDCAEEYYTAILADNVTASSDSPAVFSVAHAGGPYRPHSKRYFGGESLG